LSNARTPTSHKHGGGDITSAVANATNAANCSRSGIAGSGLTGGGAFTSDVTFTLGTPSTITTSSPNDVTATSHTHAITGFATSSHTHDISTLSGDALPSSVLSSSLTSVGTLNSGSISNGFGNINVGSENSIQGGIINANTKFQFNGSDGVTTTLQVCTSANLSYTGTQTAYGWFVNDITFNAPTKTIYINGGIITSIV
jgi:hypothetical protein